MQYTKLKKVVDKYEKNHGHKPTFIGLSESEFSVLEKELEDCAPVEYSANYDGGKGIINIFGTKVGVESN